MTDTHIWLFILAVASILSWRGGMWWESRRPEREQRAKEKNRAIVRKAKFELIAEQARKRSGQ